MFEDALARCRASLGGDHPATLIVAGNLGVAQVAAGQRRKGLKLVIDNLADRVRVFGDDHPDTLTARTRWPPRTALPATSTTPSRCRAGRAAARPQPRARPPGHADLADGAVPRDLAAAGRLPPHTASSRPRSPTPRPPRRRHHLTMTLLECGQAFGFSVRSLAARQASPRGHRRARWPRLDALAARPAAPPHVGPGAVGDRDRGVSHVGKPTVPRPSSRTKRCCTAWATRRCSTARWAGSPTSPSPSPSSRSWPAA